MSYRYTDTDKWNDKWFRGLKQLEMLLFNYLCDNCDIAGFIEADFDKWAFDLHSSADTIKGACKGLQRGLIFSNDSECVFVKNFLKHQKNLPLNENNKSHIGILRRFDKYSQTFDIKDINEFMQGACKGLQSPTGNGIGNGIGNVLMWRDDFEIYLSELNAVYNNLILDQKFIKEQEEFNPGVDIVLSLKKAVTNFWGKPAGWKHKKKTRQVENDWKATLTSAIDKNKVWKPKSIQQEQRPNTVTMPKI